MSDLTLFWLIPRDRSNRVRWLLKELDVEFSEQQLDVSTGEHRSGDYLDVNPFGKVPAIVMDNLTLSESGAILLYLLETFDTEHNLSPDRDTEYWPIFLQWFFWGLTTFESAIFAFNSDQGDKERTNLERFLAPLDHVLSSQPYLLGDTFSTADIVCGYNLGLLIRNYDFAGYPAIEAYLSRLLARPAATSFARAIESS